MAAGIARDSMVSQTNSRGKHFLFSMLLCLTSVIVALVIAEVIVRQRFAPWTIRSPVANLQPPGNYYTSNPSLGYLPTPGAFTITLPGPYSFKTTHLSNGLRITHSLETYPSAKEKEIWIFGCSFTAGWSLNDNETYAWQLQERLANYEVVNYAVNGFSTLQSLIQFREALASGRKPKVALVSYAYFHDMRNAGTGTWMKALLTAGGGPYGGLIFPYMRFSPENHAKLIHAPLEYHPFPLARYSALANLLDDRYNPSLRGKFKSHLISEIIIRQFADLCAENAIKFVLAGIYRDPLTHSALEHFEQNGVLTVDISVDPSRPENSNMPYDHHPSAFANKQYADKLQAFFIEKKLLDAQPSMPAESPQ